MRILISQEYFEDSFVDNVQITLKEMGHDVRTLDFVDHKKSWLPHKKFFRLLSQTLPDRPSPQDKKLLRIAREFRPDVLISTTGHVHESILEDLGKIVKSRRVLWWGDPPGNSEKWGVLDPGWDVVYLKDKAAVKKLNLVGRNAFLLHEAMNPKRHKIVGTQQNDSLVFAGSYYAFRQAVILRLTRDSLQCQLYGPSPPRWAHPEIKQLHSGKYLTGEGKSRVFGEALACVNTFTLAEGDSLNCRAFEVAGAGGLQLIEYRPSIAECFEPGKELLVFQTYEELLEHVNRAKQFPAEMVSIRRAGARRALAEHTYRHRLEVILGNL
jgi:spore maturation protein CgeB